MLNVDHPLRLIGMASVSSSTSLRSPVLDRRQWIRMLLASSTRAVTCFTSPPRWNVRQPRRRRSDGGEGILRGSYGEAGVVLQRFCCTIMTRQILPRLSRPRIISSLSRRNETRKRRNALVQTAAKGTAASRAYPGLLLLLLRRRGSAPIGGSPWVVVNAPAARGNRWNRRVSESINKIKIWNISYPRLRLPCSLTDTDTSKATRSQIRR